MRVGILFINEGNNVVFVIFVRSCFVGVIRALAFHSYRFVQGNHHISCIEVIESSVLELRIP